MLALILLYDWVKLFESTSVVDEGLFLLLDVVQTYAQLESQFSARTSELGSANRRANISIEIESKAEGKRLGAEKRAREAIGRAQDCDYRWHKQVERVELLQSVTSQLDEEIWVRHIATIHTLPLQHASRTRLL